MAAESAGNAIREALEPCPFCGGPAHSTPEVGDLAALVMCSENDCCTIGGATLQDATAAWNRRARTSYDAIGSGVDPRPTDDRLWDQTLTERDNYHDAADKLAEAIGELLGVNVGEHSSAHSPWETALEHAGQAVRNRAFSTHTAAGAGPVGEAVAWLFEREGDPTSPKVSSGERLTDAAKRAGWKERPLYTHPVEEPGEVERLTRERDEAMEREVKRAATLRQRIDDMLCEIAETRERLDKLLAAAGKARTALAGFTSISDAAYALDVALAAASSEVVR